MFNNNKIQKINKRQAEINKLTAEIEEEHAMLGAFLKERTSNNIPLSGTIPITDTKVTIRKTYKPRGPYKKNNNWNETINQNNNWKETTENFNAQTTSPRKMSKKQKTLNSNTKCPDCKKTFQKGTLTLAIANHKRMLHKDKIKPKGKYTKRKGKYMQYYKITKRYKGSGKYHNSHQNTTRCRICNVKRDQGNMPSHLRTKHMKELLTNKTITIETETK